MWSSTYHSPHIPFPDQHGSYRKSLPLIYVPSICAFPLFSPHILSTLLWFLAVSLSCSPIVRCRLPSVALCLSSCSRSVPSPFRLRHRSFAPFVLALLSTSLFACSASCCYAPSHFAALPPKFRLRHRFGIYERQRSDFLALYLGTLKSLKHRQTV